jgi:hypothetical protein
MFYVRNIVPVLALDRVRVSAGNVCETKAHSCVNLEREKA